MKLFSKLIRDEENLSTEPKDYEIQNPIGSGSSATVYASNYKPKNLKVAVKVIELDMFERNQIDELRKETNVMSLCRHPNLLQVYCSFVFESKLHIVTPYLEIGSCLDLIKYAHPEGIEEQYIAHILKQALKGLEYLHKNGHIHRDIKAGNLLMNRAANVFLADFGVSSSLDHNDRKNMRKTFVGTPCWMAPEVMEQSGYNYKADIWSFGITALELANGQAPLAEFPPMKVIMLTLSREPPTLDRENTKNKYSKAFKEMVDLCLKKDPNKRPNSEKLLSNSFFKQAKKVASFDGLFENLIEIDKRPQKKIITKKSMAITFTSWNFSDGSNANSISKDQEELFTSSKINKNDIEENNLNLNENKLGRFEISSNNVEFVLPEKQSSLGVSSTPVSMSPPARTTSQRGRFQLSSISPVVIKENTEALPVIDLERVNELINKNEKQKELLIEIKKTIENNETNLELYKKIKESDIDLSQDLLESQTSNLLQQVEQLKTENVELLKKLEKENTKN